jgi:hypothetical protein
MTQHCITHDNSPAEDKINAFPNRVEKFLTANTFSLSASNGERAGVRSQNKYGAAFTHSSIFFV